METARQSVRPMAHPNQWVLRLQFPTEQKLFHPNYEASFTPFDRRAKYVVGPGHLPRGVRRGGLRVTWQPIFPKRTILGPQTWPPNENPKGRQPLKRPAEGSPARH